MPDGSTFSPQTRTVKPDSVRVAGPADERALCELMIEGHTDNGILPLNPAKAPEWAHILTCHPQGKVHSVAGLIDAPDGSLAGCVVLVLVQPWYGDDWLVEERMLFVRPEYRNLRNARDLILFSRWFAEKVGLLLVIGVLSSSRSEQKMRLYGRYLKPSGGVFMHDGASRSFVSDGS